MERWRLAWRLVALYLLVSNKKWKEHSNYYVVVGVRAVSMERGDGSIPSLPLVALANARLNGG